MLHFIVVKLLTNYTGWITTTNCFMHGCFSADDIESQINSLLTIGICAEGGLGIRMPPDFI